MMDMQVVKALCYCVGGKSSELSKRFFSIIHRSVSDA